MRHSIYILLSLTMGLNGCSSQKKLETTTPFAVGEAICQDWVGGKEESGSGQVVKIAITEMTGEDITLQNIYFRGEMAEVVMEMEDQGMTATAKFYRQKPDIIMHADSTKEVGNQPPKLKSKKGQEFPFELRETECVLSYLENEKVKYVKIVGVANKPARIYPSRPQN